ncbi:septum site-determining protein MinC [Cupriavidus consociatus]|uniref:septum site-determining protein MinC n=1 Tax=Cupriavidus consociatus TaxID=2821357 RepID=UPI001AEA029A|nr:MULTISPECIES: septum site-determining protein MinC [unclassified Cupriavidus]MBP0622036.1 septum site-determining protein MinC [Cupriavidus sp. LEh25]MDK2658712.1 septum site-determining protein MinC [Cupriavidus sp. LEh21]
MSQKKSPRFELRSGNVDALLLALQTADMAALRDDLLSRFEATPDFFSNDVIALDLRALEDDREVALGTVIETLATLKARAIGVVARAGQREWAERFGLPLLDSQSRRGSGADRGAEARAAAEAEQAAAQAAEQAAAQAAAEQAAREDAIRAAAQAATDAAVAAAVRQHQTLLIDKPLRSGQQVYAHGDVVILDVVSYGAEVIAEGNIHIYAPLRGRALAGVKGNTGARIFSTCMEPELISIAGIYRTAEQTLPADVLGKTAQVRLAEEKLILEALRLK